MAGRYLRPMLMWCERSSKIIRRSSWVNSHQATDFLIGMSAALVPLGRPKSGWRATKADPVHWWGGVITIEDPQSRDRGQSGTYESRDALDPPLSSRATYEAVDEGSHSVHFLCLIISRIIVNREVAR